MEEGAMGATKNLKNLQDPNEELRRWQERFESLIGLCSEWVWEQDEDCRFTLMTGSAQGHGGINTKKFLGTHRWDRGAVPVSDGGSWDKHKAALKARQPFTDFLFKRPDSKGAVRYVSTSGQPVFDAKGCFRGYRGIAKDVRVLQPAFTPDIGIRGGFVFPVITEGKTIGVLAFNSREVREPDERLLKAILAIGSQIGQFLERKRAEEEQRRFRAAMDASADLMLLIDPTSLLYVDVNDAACRALGYSREELLTMGPPDVFSTTREELTRLYERMIAGELSAPTVRGHYRRKDGSLLPVEAYPRAVRSGDGHVIVSIARDISERLAAEEMLRRFRLAMDNSADIIVLIDR